MHWKIPSVPDKKPLTSPDYKTITVFFAIITAAIYIYSLNLSDEQKTRLLLFTLPIIALFFLLCTSFLYIRYQHSIVTYDNWENEKIETKKEWQNWCQSYITSLANVICTPDKEGARAFLMGAEAIPMYPDRKRRLFNNQKFDDSLFLRIYIQLKEQSSNYHLFLSKIYLFDDTGDVYIENIILNQWQIKPTKPRSFHDIFSDKKNQSDDTFLIITIQSKIQYSEFVSAQLFSTNNTLINSSTNTVKIERIMQFNNQDFDNKMIKYIEHSGVARNENFKTWITKTKQEVIHKILIAYSNKKIVFDKKIPVHSLELSYSAPHPDAFLNYLSLISEISTITKTDHVLIHLNPDDSGYAVYISNRP